MKSPEVVQSQAIALSAAIARSAGIARWPCILLYVSLLGMSGACGRGGPPSHESNAVGATDQISIQVDNQIHASDGGPCAPYAQSTVSLFLPDQPRIDLAPGAMSSTYQVATGGSGVGLQVNFWYWSQEPDDPVGTGPPQNPDNSGGQFVFNGDCTFTTHPAYFGKGIETYEIAGVTSAKQGGVCVVTIAKNQFTGCVTPSCCSPSPGLGQCQNTLPRQYACPTPYPPG